MMTNNWHSPNNIPEQPGVYKRRIDNGFPMYSYWDGKDWYFSAVSPEGAKREYRQRCKTAIGPVPWAPIQQSN